MRINVRIVINKNSGTEVKIMKTLNKRTVAMELSIESYNCTCSCYCSCACTCTCSAGPATQSPHGNVQSGPSRNVVSSDVQYSGSAWQNGAYV